MLTVDYNIDF